MANIITILSKMGPFLVLSMGNVTLDRDHFLKIVAKQYLHTILSEDLIDLRVGSPSFTLHCFFLSLFRLNVAASLI